MIYLKKVLLVQLPTGKVNLIPLEEILDCKIITPSDKLGFWVHEKTTTGGADYGLGDEVKVRDLNDEDIKKILANSGECFVEVDHCNELCMPSNAYNKKIVIHLSRP